MGFNNKAIGIIGFGRFSALMIQYLSKDYDVLVATRKDKREEINALGAKQTSLEKVCALDYIIISVPISAMQAVLKDIAPLLNKDATITDVCSVKEFPVKWMKEILPESVSILPTHPMFGPDSAATSLSGRKIVLCKERIETKKYNRIKTYLASKGLTIVETTPTEHDEQIAISLSLTHFVGRALSEFGASPLEIDTEGYKRLLHILEVVENDTWELFLDMHRYNPYAKSVRTQFTEAMNKINMTLDQSTIK